MKKAAGMLCKNFSQIELADTHKFRAVPRSSEVATFKWPPLLTSGKYLPRTHCHSALSTATFGQNTSQVGKTF